MYRVLTPRPKTAPTGQVLTTASGEEVAWHKVTDWPELGTARDMDEARAKFGGRPVLEWIGNTH